MLQVEVFGLSYFFFMQSNLEFNVRMQEFVELVRRGDKMEAVRYVIYLVFD